MPEPEELAAQIREMRPISAVCVAAGEYVIQTKSGVKLWHVEGRSLAEWVCSIVNIVPTLLTENEKLRAAAQELLTCLDAPKDVMTTPEGMTRYFNAIKALRAALEGKESE